MPQFDIVTIGPQIFGLLLSLYFFYLYNITVIVSNFIEVKKIRTKKVFLNSDFVDFFKAKIVTNFWTLDKGFTQSLV
jgi:hypothetical protein